MPGIYVHVPFCLKKCPYCDFESFDNSITLAEEYIDCILLELKYYIERFPGAWGLDPGTLYIGGGTPTLLTEKQMEKLFRGIYALIKKEKFSEITIESNPETMTKEKAGIIAENATRVSLGVQSFDDSTLETLGRVHNAATAVKAAELLKKAGVNNFNIDLMFGTAGSDKARALNDIKTAASLSPKHISYYMLTVYKGTPYFVMHQGGGLAKEEDLEEMYIEGALELEKLGFKQYEVSNFSFPGFECAHNLAYWDMKDYAGLGSSAASFWQGSRFVNVKKPREYIDRIKSGVDPADFIEKYDDEKFMREYVMLSLRKKRGLDTAGFAGKFGFDFAGKYSKMIETLEKGGYAELKNGRLSLTLKGFLVSNEIIASFF